MLAKGTRVSAAVAGARSKNPDGICRWHFLMLWERIPRRGAEQMLKRGKNPAKVLRQARAEWLTASGK